eukprot:TRINITY_DN2262_c0_g1_i3.p5 TRINITY_DN2262_c0_g1~~TRINITY_DN2262_c0_g1_i3.p5  ORF type:complete len:147 (+),score=0.38 TRINITY_DN2262_c0_g1_i3:297-737(+)
MVDNFVTFEFQQFFCFSFVVELGKLKAPFGAQIAKMFGAFSRIFFVCFSINFEKVCLQRTFVRYKQFLLITNILYKEQISWSQGCSLYASSTVYISTWLSFYAFYFFQVCGLRQYLFLNTLSYQLQQLDLFRADMKLFYCLIVAIQ